MSKKKFNLEDYKTGQYSVELVNGNEVEIVAIDEARDTIFGFYNDGRINTATNWNIDGTYFQTGNPDSRDLYLRPKLTTVHINIIRSKSGKILSYCATSKARVKAGGTLLKYLTIEV